MSSPFQTYWSLCPLGEFRMADLFWGSGWKWRQGRYKCAEGLDKTVLSRSAMWSVCT